MIENVAGVGGLALSGFLGLNHIGHSTDLMLLMVAKFARDAGGEVWRTSQSGR
jgi:hypothetical protein